FSPPFYKFRNICQKTIKYTNFDYSKTNFVKMCPLRENFKKGNTLRALEPQGIEKKFDFFFWYATWEGVLLFSCMMLFIENRRNPLISILYRYSN
ncbi:hypothetical protein PDJ85_27515, partial [Bacillus cereus group sp. TH260-2LC]|nr:hypothetical protein [Bacillus cereus group sp. TH260-2LC]